MNAGLQSPGLFRVHVHLLLFGPCERFEVERCCRVVDDALDGALAGAAGDEGLEYGLGAIAVFLVEVCEVIGPVALCGNVLVCAGAFEDSLWWLSVERVSR